MEGCETITGDSCYNCDKVFVFGSPILAYGILYLLKSYSVHILLKRKCHFYLKALVLRLCYPFHVLETIFSQVVSLLFVSSYEGNGVLETVIISTGLVWQFSKPLSPETGVLSSTSSAPHSGWGLTHQDLTFGPSLSSSWRPLHAQKKTGTHWI